MLIVTDEAVKEAIISYKFFAPVWDEKKIMGDEEIEVTHSTLSRCKVLRKKKMLIASSQ